MQRNGELDHAEAGAEMAASHGDGVDGLLPQLVGNLPQLAGVKAAQVRGCDVGDVCRTDGREDHLAKSPDDHGHGEGSHAVRDADGAEADSVEQDSHGDRDQRRQTARHRRDPELDHNDQQPVERHE